MKTLSQFFMSNDFLLYLYNIKVNAFILGIMIFVSKYMNSDILGKGFQATFICDSRVKFYVKC